jgi:hypothetical protein
MVGGFIRPKAMTTGLLVLESSSSFSKKDFIIL